MANDTMMPVRGHLEPATREGFGRMIQQANVAYADGLTLVGLVPIGEGELGGIFVRIPKPAESGSLV